jgi:hypothetical protein
MFRTSVFIDSGLRRNESDGRRAALYALVIFVRTHFCSFAARPD